eukprot:4154706-Pleurochrysis_carterae.AAC.4
MISDINLDALLPISTCLHLGCIFTRFWTQRVALAIKRAGFIAGSRDSELGLERAVLEHSGAELVLFLRSMCEYR